MPDTELKDVAYQPKDLVGKYLTFKLGREEYGLQILKVQEIIEMIDITRVPRTPPYVKGVINLRGKVIPVVDLRLKFGLEEKDVTRTTCIIVVYVQRQDTEITMGLVVDEVSEVSEIGVQQIEPPPSFGASVDTEFILAMAKKENSVTTLMDIDKVLSERELVALETASQG
jgi:purine-binding chemotaxis protein CheW